MFNIIRAKAVIINNKFSSHSFCCSAVEGRSSLKHLFCLLIPGRWEQKLKLLLMLFSCKSAKSLLNFHIKLKVVKFNLKQQRQERFKNIPVHYFYCFISYYTYSNQIMFIKFFYNQSKTPYKT